MVKDNDDSFGDRILLTWRRRDVPSKRDVSTVQMISWVYHHMFLDCTMMNEVVFHYFLPAHLDFDFVHDDSAMFWSAASDVDDGYDFQRYYFCLLQWR